jgi:hypothetical protein
MDRSHRGRGRLIHMIPPGENRVSRPVAALFVETDGAYWNLPGVEPWDEARDARKYAGPHPVVAHPPCQRWGRFWHGSTRKPHQFKKGDDGGCFAAAFTSLLRFGGVLEHPADSHAWEAFCIPKPPREGGWIPVVQGVWTCCVYQGQYGHLAGKPTWLIAARIRDLPELRWGKTEQRIHPRALELHGYEKARRIGMMAMVGGKDKTRIRNATPPEFRDVLLDLARRTSTMKAAA